MAITQVITTLPTAPDPATDTRDQFSTKAAASVLAQKAMVPELNAWAAQVNAIAEAAVGDVATAIGAASADTPVDADKFCWRKTADGLLKSITWANIKAALGSWLQVQTAIHCGTTGGTSTAFTAAATPAIGANTANTRIRATLHTAAGTTPTLAVNGLTALPIRYRKYDGTLVAMSIKQAPTNWTSDFEIDSTATYWVMLQTAMPNVSQTIKVTRAMDAASGDVSYTLEFKPEVLHIVAVVDGNSGRSEGWAYGTTENCTTKFGGDATTQNVIANKLVYFTPDAASVDIQTAILKSMDAAGCTLTWERTGTTSSAVVTLYITAFP